MKPTMSNIVRSVFVLSVAPLVAGEAKAQYPTTPPPPGPLRELQLPPFTEVSLDNGLRIVLVENHELPVTTVWLTMQGGSTYEPVGKEGTAALAADLLLRGTTNRTADEIAEQIEGTGSSLNVNAGADFFGVSTTVLTEHTELAFELIADVVRNSTFPEEEVELTRTRMLSALRGQESQPAFLASKFFNEALYGDHPYGRTGTSATVTAISRNDVLQFVSGHLRPRGAVLVLAGDITESDGTRLADRYFGEWTGTGPDRPITNPPQPRATEIILVNRPNSPQSNITVGNLTMRPGDPDYYEAVIANKILGGGSDARLFQILREDKGWTYGAYSNHNRPVDVARFQATAEVRTEVTDSALVELIAQIHRMRTEAVSEEELDAAKGNLLGSFPRQIETPQQIASQVRNTRLLNLEDQYLQTYRERLAAVSSDDVLDVSGRLMRPDSSVIVVVGDGAAIYDKLAAIAPTRIIDTEGKELTPADLYPDVGPLAFDFSHVVAGVDSFSVLVQGNEFGFLTRDYQMADQDGRSVIIVTSALSLGPIGNQTSTLTVDSVTMRPLSFDQTGQLQGASSEVHLTYDNGHITGEVSVPQPTGGRREAVVDTTVVEHVIDDNMLQTFAGALPLTEGATITTNAYDANQGVVSIITLAVQDGGSVTVPAGTYDTWIVHMTGAAAPLTYWVAKDGNRHLVKMAIVGQPLEFVLVTPR